MNKRIPTVGLSGQGLSPKRPGRPLVTATLLKPKTPEERLAVRIRQRRTSLLLSQAELAARMSELGQPWHQTTVAKTERAERELRYPELVALAQVLSVPLVELVDDEEATGPDALERRKRELDLWLLERRLEFVDEDIAVLQEQRQQLLLEIQANLEQGTTPRRPRKT